VKARMRAGAPNPARPRAMSTDAMPPDNTGRLLNLIRRFSEQRIAVLGDFVADEFVSGDISRVSREAPVLILRHRRSEFRPGGGANAVNNLADLDAQVLAVGLLGDDAAGRALLGIFRSKGVDCSGVVLPREYATPMKTRFLAGWAHTAAQQVLRVDREPEQAQTDSICVRLEENARKRARRADALLISDYGLGAITPKLARSVNGKLVTLDSRHAMLAYRDAKITAATPNEPEIEALYHATTGGGEKKLGELGERALKEMRMQALLVTRGKHGSVLFERGHTSLAIAAFGDEDAVDVTGAGDTVIAAFTLALAAGGSFSEAARLANYAGGIVVMKRGTATVSREELEEAVASSPIG
jgi:rfaE bifunctional protein kinase chain/domain